MWVAQAISRPARRPTHQWGSRIWTGFMLTAPKLVPIRMVGEGGVAFFVHISIGRILPHQPYNRTASSCSVLPVLNWWHDGKPTFWRMYRPIRDLGSRAPSPVFLTEESGYHAARVSLHTNGRWRERLRLCRERLMDRELGRCISGIDRVKIAGGSAIARKHAGMRSWASNLLSRRTTTSGTHSPFAESISDVESATGTRLHFSTVSY